MKCLKQFILVQMQTHLGNVGRLLRNSININNELIHCIGTNSQLFFFKGTRSSKLKSIHADCIFQDRQVFLKSDT